MTRLTPPDFIFAGPPKSGSTWLAENLSEHPEIFVPPAKDVMYFDSQYHRPIEWYYRFFARAGGRVAGEVCHNYFEHPLAAERIRAHLPGVKLIFTLRDPLERARSHWLLSRALGLDRGVDFVTFCRQPECAAINDYLANLSRYYERFPTSQIYVFFYRQIRKAPADMMRELFQFLGVDEDFTPPSLHRRILPASAARLPLLSATAWHAAKWMRNRGGANLVGWLKRHPLTLALLFRPLDEPPEISLADQEAFFEEHRKTYPAIARLIGRELPGLWHTPPSARRKANYDSLEGQARPTLT